jgi:hypothetical protein
VGVALTRSHTAKVAPEVMESRVERASLRALGQVKLIRVAAANVCSARVDNGLSTGRPPSV